MKERIIGQAIILFNTYGIKGLTTEGIVKELGISKRTLYEHFSCKEQLLMECLQFRLNSCELFAPSEAGLIDELLTLYAGMKQLNLQSAHRFCLELHKFYTPAYKMLLERLLDYASICSKKIGQGIEEGYIRHDVRPNIVCAAIFGYLTQLFTCVGTDYVDIRKIFSPESIILFTRGLCTIKGRNYLDHKFKELPQ